jgi:plasmid stabilization system protein ParE
MKIIWSPLAMERVADIARSIAQDNPTAAEKWVDTIFEKVGQLEFMPEGGRLVPEMRRNDFRELLHGNYRIIYRTDDEQVLILTVRHGRQILPVDEIVPEIIEATSADIH